jgi:hypothetical protein
MKEQIDRIVYDITYRVPERRIVLRNGSYYIFSGTDSFELSHQTVYELLESGYVTKNVHGGLVVTNTAREHAETLVKRLKKPNPDQPGKQIDYCEVPEPYGEN